MPASTGWRSATARWLYEALRQAPDVRATVGRSFEEWHAAWRDDHADLHGFQRLVEGLDARFTRRSLQWVPYLAAEYIDRGLEPSERALIEEGVIEASAFRYVALRP